MRLPFKPFASLPRKWESNPQLDILVNFLQIILTVQRGLATTHPLDVVNTIYLLVLRVRTIVTSSNRQKYYVLLKGVLQGQGHRDTTPIASQVGRHAMNCLKRQNIVKTYAVFIHFPYYHNRKPSNNSSIS